MSDKQVEEAKTLFRTVFANWFHETFLGADPEDYATAMLLGVCLARTIVDEYGADALQKLAEEADGAIAIDHYRRERARE